MLTRQNYKAIAEIINHQIDPACVVSEDPCCVCSAIEIIANNLTNYLAKDNPHFDREKFLEACGL